MMVQVLLQDPFQYLSFVVGILGVIIAILQGFERKKLKQFMHSQAWHLYSVSQLSFGSAQSALKTYKNKTNGAIDADVYEQLSKCDAFNVSLFLEVIRQIQLAEPKFDIETISTWKIQGRIQEDMAPYFIKASAMKSPSIPRMAFNLLTFKIRRRLTKAITNQNPNKSSKTNKN